MSTIDYIQTLDYIQTFLIGFILVWIFSETRRLNKLTRWCRKSFEILTRKK